ncbi:unnamed protein product [Dicrocoelium dendriticum]|nr:unnamed protein product [Dicrocoelium dendriticum]
MIKQAQDRAGQSEEKYDLSEEVTSPPFPENCVVQPTETYPPPCHSLSSLSWLGQHATTAEYYNEAEKYANPLFRFDIKRTFDSPSPSSSSLHNERTAAVSDGAVSGEKSTVTWLSGRSYCSQTDTNQVAFEVKEITDESPVYLLDKRYASVSSSEVSPCSSALQCLQTWLQQQQPLQRWDASCMKYVSAQCPVAQTNR